MEDLSPSLRVEVAYASAHEQVLIALVLPAPASVAQAIDRSGLLARFPQIDLARQPVGIFGRPCELTSALRDGDRVEVYRPLSADPKEARRARVQAARARASRRSKTSDTSGN